MSEGNKVDVLIIGAGPAGLMCANALLWAGLKVKIIDKQPFSVMAGQADGIHCRTIEVLQSYGLADRLIRESAHMHRAAFYDPDPNGDGIVRTRVGRGFTSPTARYGFTCGLHQGRVEAIFLDDMKSRGLVVDRPAVPTSIELSDEEAARSYPKAYPVKVCIKYLERAESEGETVHAKFVLGADGAHSWVRRAMGITMEGDTSDHIWGVVDILPDTDYPDHRNVSLVQSHRGSALLIPRERDLFRLYIQLEDTDVVDPETARLDKTRMSPQKIMEKAQEILRPFRINAIGDIDWWTVYVVGQRVAETYSVADRVFIAGDACHTHSPKAGQGMNASMIDTHNLAWKLAYVLRGWAPMSLLKTYEAERRKYALDLIEFDKKWASMFTGGGDPQEDELHEMFAKNAGFTSGLTLHYEPSVIVDNRFQACAPHLIVGKRMLPIDFICAADARPVNIHDMLLADMRFKILTFVGNFADETGAAKVRALAEQLTAPDCFLQRYAHTGTNSAFDLICISASRKEQVDYTDFPAVFRSHWSKVLLDDTDMLGRSGGGGFARCGIAPESGAFVVVRPDGHIGIVAPCDRIDALNNYFGAFLLVAA
ncbi:uncharacterized protein TRAVEDRAFT_47634 [Trametes versicolor FP-101664 SS1]|uniref:uncharacterized protein n=1 Tax=Trametes versicolor (strain FP-101664) TaxID=717944 RepID=UPI0004622991|nr:uncharacterized protein TRAVEDRAFT_47634 [Trametes versicolor FP-101664 SS1]EIW58484.1 hypothetical protein TRAVEDRAFT_47634 [Trametes versicolor FP-101664 SS1]